MGDGDIKFEKTTNELSTLVSAHVCIVDRVTTNFHSTIYYYSTMADLLELQNFEKVVYKKNLKIVLDRGIYLGKEDNSEDSKALNKH